MERIVNVNDYEYLPKANRLLEEGWQIAEILNDFVIILTDDTEAYDKKRGRFITRARDDGKEIIKRMQKKL